MNKISKLQLAVITGALALFVFLLFANTTPPAKKKDINAEPEPSHATVDFDQMINEGKSTIDVAGKERIENYEEQIEKSTPEQKAGLFDSLIKLYDGAQKPAIAAFYTEQKNLIKPNASGWMQAGNRYYSAIGFVKEDQRHALYEKAIDCYTKAAELDPQNAEIKTALAVCYVEGTGDPMKGITMLREVVAADSTNISAQVNLGLFAIKSAQYDKAIARFKKIIAINENYLEAYLYLADCYEKVNDKKSAIENLEKYKAKVEDVTIKAEVQNYIDKLSQTN